MSDTDQVTTGEIDGWIQAALPGVTLKLATVAADTVFLEACVKPVEGFALALFDAVADGANDGRFTDAVAYERFLQAMAARLVDKLKIAPEVLQESLAAGAGALRERALLIRMPEWTGNSWEQSTDLRIGPDPVPSSVHAIFAPADLLEKHAADGVGSILRFHAVAVRALLTDAFRGRIPYQVARYKTPALSSANATAAGAAPSSCQPEVLSVGAKLRVARDRTGLSRTQVAKSLKGFGVEISPDAIKKHESDKAIPRHPVREGYARVYHCSVEELFGQTPTQITR